MALDPIKPTGVFTAWMIPTDSSAGSGITGQLGQDPGDTNPPIIFEPDSDLSGGDTEVWIIASGGVNWGGAQVHVSLDDTTYGQIGTILSGASQGYLSNTFPSGADPDTVNTLSVDLTESRGQIIAGTVSDADFKLPTLAYCDTELISFSAATLTAPFLYDLDTYIRRGCYKTTIASHASGTQFALIRSAFSYEYLASLIGTTVYFKFPSFNTLGGQLQDIADCVAYPYTLIGNGQDPTCVLLTESKTINYTILDTDDCKHFNNIGAPGDIVLTLPPAEEGLHYGFLVVAASYVKIQAVGGDVISRSVETSAPAGYIRSNIPYAFLTIESHSAGTWIVSSQVGTWSIDS